MGMAVFMKTAKEAQEFSRMKKAAGGEAAQVGRGGPYPVRAGWELGHGKGRNLSPVAPLAPYHVPSRCLSPVAQSYKPLKA